MSTTVSEQLGPSRTVPSSSFGGWLLGAVSNVRNCHRRGADHDAQTPGEVLFEEAYARLLPEFKALTIEELIAINLDIPLVVTTTLGAGPEILGLADRYGYSAGSKPTPTANASLTAST
jgi:hypothetical protein